MRKRKIEGEGSFNLSSLQRTKVKERTKKGVWLAQVPAVEKGKEWMRKIKNLIEE
jgi:hypothetical protein